MTLTDAAQALIEWGEAIDVDGYGPGSYGYTTGAHSRLTTDPLRREGTLMKQLTAEQARSYYTHCPTCDSRDFYSYSLMGEGCEMWQKFRCDDCEAVWIEVFLLYRIEKGD